MRKLFADPITLLLFMIIMVLIVSMLAMPHSLPAQHLPPASEGEAIRLPGVEASTGSAAPLHLLAYKPQQPIFGPIVPIIGGIYYTPDPNEPCGATNNNVDLMTATVICYDQKRWEGVTALLTVLAEFKRADPILYESLMAQNHLTVRP